MKRIKRVVKDVVIGNRNNSCLIVQTKSKIVCEFVFNRTYTY